MFYSIKIILISFLISFIFYGCNLLNFSKKEEVKLEGKRYEILDYKRELIVSEEAALVPVMLGDIEKNSSWNQSGRTASHSPGNLFLDENQKVPSAIACWFDLIYYLKQVYFKKAVVVA